jgi:hypothetical protein
MNPIAMLSPAKPEKRLDHAGVLFFPHTPFSSLSNTDIKTNTENTEKRIQRIQNAPAHHARALCAYAHTPLRPQGSKG